VPASDKNLPARPVVLEPAALPREQMGPYFILGVDKAADKEQVEAAWAQRLIWARKGIVRIPLEDINWAREVMSDFDKRVRADASSLNLDTVDGVVRKLRDRFAGHAVSQAGCLPLDRELPLADFSPDIPIPGLEEVRDNIAVPPIPEEFPAVSKLLQDLVQEPIDPWNLTLEAGETEESAGSK
jgi:hypothetical protein